MLEEDELMHYGVLGMKWGVRKDRSSGSGKGKSKKNSKSKKKSSTKKSITPSLKSMTDDELRTKIQRMKLEKEYKQFYKELNPEKKKRGKKFVDNTLDELTKKVPEAIGDFGKKATSAALNKRFGPLLDVQKAAVSTKQLTDEALQAAVRRMKLEDQYRELYKKRS